LLSLSSAGNVAAHQSRAGTHSPAAARSKPRPRGAPRAQTPSIAETLQSTALELFAEQNYATVTIKDIAQKTGINSSLIYYYHRNKEELFLSVIESVVQAAFEKFESLRASSDEPVAIIHAWIEIHVVQFVLLQKLAKMSLDYASRRPRTARIDRAIRKFYDLEAAVLQRCIKDGIERGQFRKVDPVEMATFISTFLDGSLFRAMMFPKFHYKRAISHMRQLVLDRLKQPTR